MRISHRHPNAAAGGEPGTDDWGWLAMVEADTADAGEAAPGGATASPQGAVYICPGCGEQVLVELREAFSVADEP